MSRSPCVTGKFVSSLLHAVEADSQGRCHARAKERQDCDFDRRDFGRGSCSGVRPELPSTACPHRHWIPRHAFGCSSASTRSTTGRALGPATRRGEPGRCRPYHRGGYRRAGPTRTATRCCWETAPRSLPRPGLYKALAYDPAKDFAPITLVAVAPMWLVAHPSVPATSLREFIAYGKQYKGTLDFASAGPGTGPHMTNEQLRLATGIDLVNIQYKGGGAAVTAIMSGEAKAGFVVAANMLSFVNAGKLKAYAVSEQEAVCRSAGRPDRRRSGTAGLRVHLLGRNAGAGRHVHPDHLEGEPGSG